jgi:hypothetical protein
LAALEREVRDRFDGSWDLRKESRRRTGGLQKKYFEEVRPLGLFVGHLFQGRTDVLCEPNLDNSKNFDATITVSSGPTLRRIFVEFTYAKDGYEDHLRRRVLNDLGHVNASGRVSLSGTRNSGQSIVVENETVFRKDILKKQLLLILERLERKAEKNMG